jgi:hypothetical protein
MLISCSSNLETSGMRSLLKITAVSPDSGMIGDSVQIFGSGFVPQISGNKITFGGVSAVVRSVTAHSLMTSVPKGAVSGPVKLTVDGQTVRGPYFKVLTPGPSITSISPQKGPAGTQVTIRGRHFLSGIVKSAVKSGGGPIKKVTETADTLSVDTLSGVHRFPRPKPGSRIKIEPPTKRVVIAPSRMASESRAHSELTITVSVGNVLAPILSISDTKIIIEIPKEAAGGLIRLTTGGKSVSSDNFHVIAAPVITDMTPKKGPAGTTVRLEGKGFCSKSDSNTVTFNGTKATVKSVSKTKLTVVVPKGATTGMVKVKVNGQTAAGPTFTVTKTSAPQMAISGIAPKNGPVGAKVTIKGKNFSASKSKNTVTFNGTKATVKNASKTKLVVAVPRGATTGSVKVTADGQTAAGPTFTITKNLTERLAITDITPKSGPISIKVAITGQNFSPIKTKNTVTFNGTQATVKSASDTKLIVTVPKDATTGVVKLQVGSQTATGPTFTITKNPAKQLTITGICPKKGPIGTKVTIKGKNFSTSKSKNTVTFNGIQATIKSASDTKLIVTVPKRATSGNVKITANGQTATGPTFTVTVNHPPKFTDTQTAYSIYENTTSVTSLTAIDPDGDDITYSISGGADRSDFTIGKTSGKLAFKTAPDFDNPTDADGNNIYEVQVQAGEGELTATKALAITVVHKPAAPELGSAAITANNKDFSASGSNGTYKFKAIPSGIKLAKFKITIPSSVDPIAGVTFGGTDGSIFSATLINNDGYTLFLNTPALQYKHSADGYSHQYRFRITVENAAGQATSWSFIIPVQPFAGGGGASADPYRVVTLQQLQRVGQFLQGHFVQAADIDASSTFSWNSGKGFVPIGDKTDHFTGTYDGGGHVISGLAINRPQANFIGLFGAVGSGGVLKSINLESVDIIGNSAVAGVAGDNVGNITRSYATGTVTGKNFVGGLVGVNTGGITRSYATENVSGNAVGGLVGANGGGGSIAYSYATGAVTVNGDQVGGLAGYNAGSITNSYATSTVTGTPSFVGGLVGNNPGGNVKKSYWDTQSTGQTTSDGGTGLTTSQMQGMAAKTYMTGFDFSAVWQIVSNGYPILQGVGGQ